MASSALEPTLIGLCDGELDPGRHRTSFLTNKVGGPPDWLPVISRPCPRCRRCGAPLVLVVQVYCPVDTSPYHRNLHLFACPAAGCGGSAETWTVLRSQCLEAKVAEAARSNDPPAPAQVAPLAATDWCDTADDWGMEEEEDGWGEGEKNSETQEEETAPKTEGRDDPKADGETEVIDQLQDLRLGRSQQDVAKLRPFFISVVDESDLGSEEDDLRHAQQLLREYERREGVAVGELEGRADGGEEKYEKTRARHGDAIFSRFMKKIGLCPQQILRYCRGGEPLFISEPPSPMTGVVSPCGSCGGPRTFELQLMPALVSLLQRTGGDGEEVELEFGTVLVYTCTKSCWTAGSPSAVEEICFVQTDPDQQLFR